MLPGGSPFKELAESLRRVAVGEVAGLAELLAEDEGGVDRVIRRVLPGDGELLLVIDQFEELFTLATEADQRAFLNGLMYAVRAPQSRLRVVATLRADFYDRPLAFQPFGAAVNDATVTIAAMLPADLEAAIVEPAERVGRTIDRALAAELVGALADEPAALPSLQFTLYELAERSPDGHMTLAAYRQIGGIEGAIASRAELLYQSLDDEERVAVRRMFERLVVVGAEGEATRRRATRTELLGDVAGVTADGVIDRWAEARLLTLDRHPDAASPPSSWPTGAPQGVAAVASVDRRGSWRADRAGPPPRGGVDVEELDRDAGRALPRHSARGRARCHGESGGRPARVEREFLDAGRSERDQSSTPRRT